MEKNIVNLEDVEHVAELSRLEFSGEELKKIQEDLSSIVDYCSLLSSINVENDDDLDSEPGALREDVVKESLPKSEIVKNAPVHNESAFIVPRVVE